MPLKTLICSLKDFWEENVSTNYKKISIAIGSFIITISNTIFLHFFVDICPKFETIWNAIFILIVIFSMSFFGSRKDSNGMEFSEKEIEKVLNNFPSLASFFRKVQADVKHTKRLLENNPDLRAKFKEFLESIEKEQYKIKKDCY